MIPLTAAYLEMQSVPTIRRIHLVMDYCALNPCLVGGTNLKLVYSSNSRCIGCTDLCGDIPVYVRARNYLV